MKPTPELRYVERELPDGIGKVRTVKILQQKWAWYFDDGSLCGFEWQDVPLEEEE
jgi:hypothetical protein